MPRKDWSEESRIKTIAVQGTGEKTNGGNFVIEMDTVCIYSDTSSSTFTTFGYRPCCDVAV